MYKRQKKNSSSLINISFSYKLKIDYKNITSILYSIICHIECFVCSKDAIIKLYADYTLYQLIIVLGISYM